MVFPIGDDNVAGGSKPYFSYGFIALNVLVFFAQLASPGNLVCEFATIPNDVMEGKNLFTGITSMFLHGGWMHLIGNMLYLWIFGDNIEACIGNVRFVIFYILGGIVASAAHVLLGASGDTLANCCEVCAAVNPCDALGQGAKPCPGSIPSLGASGAIAAVMGAYLVMFPKSKIKMIAIIFGTFTIPAFLFLVFWIGQQLFSVFGSAGMGHSSGVAWWAHIGGFVFGLLIGLLYKGRAQWNHPTPDSNQGPGYV